MSVRLTPCLGLPCLDRPTVVDGTPPPYAWGIGATRRGQKLPQ